MPRLLLAVSSDSVVPSRKDGRDEAQRAAGECAQVTPYQRARRYDRWEPPPPAVGEFSPSCSPTMIKVQGRRSARRAISPAERCTRQAQVRPRLASAVVSSCLGSPAQLARLVLATSERTVVVAADQPGGNDGGWALSRHSGGAAVRP